MQCTKCRHETDMGSYYRIYYGNPVSSSYPTWVKGRQQITTTIQLEEPEDVFLCDRCVNKWTRIKHIVFTIFLLWLSLLCILFLSAPLPLAGSIAFIGMALLFLFSAFLLGYFKLVRKPKTNTIDNEVGELLALNVRRKSLEKQGYRVFFRRGQYQSSLAQGIITPLAFEPPLKTRPKSGKNTV